VTLETGNFFPNGVSPVSSLLLLHLALSFFVGTFLPLLEAEMLLLTSHGTFSYGGCGGCVTFVYAELEQVLCGCCFAVVGFQVVACSSSRNGYISNPFPGCLVF
jgi:hypothetical protein